MTTETITRPAVKLESVPGYTELSRRTGVSASTYCRVFSPDPQKARWPGEETAEKTAKALGITVGQFFDLVYLRREVERRRRAALAGQT